MPGFFWGSGGPANAKDVEFHRAHRWEIEDLGIPNATVSGSVTRATASLNPRFYAQSLQLPNLTFEEEKVKSASLIYKVAKSAKYSNTVVKFYDLWGLHKVFKEWQDLIWTPEEGIKAAQDYKGIAIFNLTDGRGNDKQCYEIHGCYPVNVTHSELTYTNHNIKILTVTYSFDFARVTFKDDISGAAAS